MTWSLDAEARLGLSIGLGGLTAVLDTTIAVLAVPVLVRSFSAPLSSVQWVSTAYVLALVAVIPIAAALGGRVGFRRAYVGALVVFALASVLAALAPTLGTLVAARVLQGLGGGLVNPLGTTLALRGTPAQRRGRVMALLGVPLLAGPLLGPVVAGSLLDSFGWRSVFVITVPPALLAAALVHRLAPTDPPRPAATSGRVDLAGAALLVPGVVAVVWAVGEATAPAAARMIAGVAGGALSAAFVRRAWHHRAPLLRVRLLSRPGFGWPAVVLTLFAAAYFGSMLLSPTYVQSVRGQSALAAGGIAMIGGLATGVSAQIATRLVDRVPPRRVVASGLALAGVTLAVGVGALRVDTPYGVLLALAAGLGAGSGAVLLPTITAATRELDGDELASGSTITTLLSQLAAALGTAVVTAGYGAAVAWRAPGLAGGVSGLARLDPAARAAVVPDVVDAQRITQAATLLVVLLAAALVARLPDRHRERESSRERRCPREVGV